jgi:ArsR family transcriptional regulator
MAPIRSRDISVAAGTGYELLVLLYRQIQADHGLPVPDLAPGLAVPPELRPDADLFFRGDIALGMNVIPVAHESCWHGMAELASGLEGLADPQALAVAMLRPPDASRDEIDRRDRDVAAVIAGSAPRGPLLEAMDAERFDATAASELLDDPTGAVRAFADLVGGYARAIGQLEQDLASPLDAAARRARALVADAGPEGAAAELFPQWTFHDLATFESVVLIPSAAMAPYLSSRVVGGEKAVIVFPVPADAGPSLDSLVAGLKAMAHPQRLEILRLAAASPITGQQLAVALGLTEATVHHHTSLLRGAGLLTSNRDAHRIYHTVRVDALDALLDHARRRLYS